jgi:hypothetical protein
VEQIMQRYAVIEVMGLARQAYSDFAHGIPSLPALAMCLPLPVEPL